MGLFWVDDLHLVWLENKLSFFILIFSFQIYIPLVEGRPGANEINPELVNFSKARYVRFRLLGLRGNREPLPHWLKQDIWKEKKMFYSIRDMSIGGRCLCNGHAKNCRHNVASGVSNGRIYEYILFLYRHLVD